MDRRTKLAHVRREAGVEAAQPVASLQTPRQDPTRSAFRTWFRTLASSPRQRRSGSPGNGSTRLTFAVDGGTPSSNGSVQRSSTRAAPIRAASATSRSIERSGQIVAAARPAGVEERHRRHHGPAKRTPDDVRGEHSRLPAPVLRPQVERRVSIGALERREPTRGSGQEWPARPIDDLRPVVARRPNLDACLRCQAGHRKDRTGLPRWQGDGHRSIRPSSRSSPEATFYQRVGHARRRG